MDINIFSKEKHSIGEELDLFKGIESGSNHIVDEKFISQNKKESQNEENTNEINYHNSDFYEIPKLSDGLEPKTLENNAPTPNVGIHEEIETPFKKN